MSSKEFRTIMSDLSQLGESCTIAVSKDGVTFSVSGDMATANVMVRQKTSVDVDSKEKTEPCIIDMKEPVSLAFNIKYLNHFTKATPLCDRVTLSLSAQNPLVVEYLLSSSGDIKYYLAPKLDEESSGA